MQTSTTYTINKIKTLVDLNQDLVNFSLRFSVTSENKQPFQMAIVDDTTMNTTDTIPYQDIKTGYISGELTWKRNVKQTYYMVLIANAKTDVVVDLTIDQLPDVIDEDEGNKATKSGSSSSPSSSATATQDDSTRYYLYIALAVILGGVAWMMLTRSSGKGGGGGNPFGAKPTILAKLKQMQLR